MSYFCSGKNMALQSTLPTDKLHNKHPVEDSVLVYSHNGTTLPKLLHPKSVRRNGLCSPTTWLPDWVGDSLLPEELNQNLHSSDGDCVYWTTEKPRLFRLFCHCVSTGTSTYHNISCSDCISKRLCSWFVVCTFICMFLIFLKMRAIAVERIWSTSGYLYK